MKKTIIVTGGDSKFFALLFAALRSLRTNAILDSYDFGILDQGLDDTQKDQLSQLGCAVVMPTWTLPVPPALRKLANIGLVARTALRDYFPGYELYIWFDADAWMQTPEFIEAFISGARDHGAAVVTENGKGYRKTLREQKWWLGNMFAAYGLSEGAKCCLAPSVNIGVLCLTSTAPHWDSWVRLYTQALERTGKVNLDQHAFLAAICIDRLDTALLPARFNWLPRLSHPLWDDERKVLCEPVTPYRPLSVVHLAGPEKEHPYRIKSLKGGSLVTSLTYSAMQPRLGLDASL